MADEEIVSEYTIRNSILSGALVLVTLTEKDCSGVTLTDDISSGSLSTLRFTAHKVSSHGETDARTTIDILSMAFVPWRTAVEFRGRGFYFTGVVYSVKESLQNNGCVEVCCEDMRGLLKGAFVCYGPQEDDDDQSRSAHSGKKGCTLYNMLYSLSTAFNNVFGDKATWTNRYGDNGNIGNTTLLQDVSIDGQSFYEAVKTLADATNLECRVIHYSTEDIIIEWDKKLGTSGTQQILTGLNLQSFTKTLDISNTYTAIMPFGGYGYNDHRLTLSSNDFDITGNIMTNTAMVSLFGLKIQPVIYDDIVVNSEDEYTEKRNELISKATEDVKKLGEDVLSIEVDAIDLSLVNPNSILDNFQCWNTYVVNDVITGTKVSGRISHSEISFDDPSDSSYTFDISFTDLYGE